MKISEYILSEYIFLKICVRYYAKLRIKYIKNNNKTKIGLHVCKHFSIIIQINEIQTFCLSGEF